MARALRCLGALILLAGSPAFAADDAPLRFDPPVLRLGEAPRGARVPGQVELVNASRAEVRYLGQGLRCVRVAVSPGAVPPGGRATVRVEVDTGALPGDGLDGLSLAFGRGLERFELRLPVELSVETLFLTMPQVLDFGQVVLGAEPPAATLFIRPRAQYEAEFHGVAGSAGLSVTTTGLPRHEGRITPQLLVTLRAPQRVGTYEGELRFALREGPLETLVVPVRAQVRSDVELVGDGVDFGRVVVGGPAPPPARVELRSSVRPIEVLGVDAAGPAPLTAIALPRAGAGAEPERSAAIAVVLDAGALRPGPIAGAARVRIDRVELPCVTIPVRGEAVAPLAVAPAAVYLDLRPPDAPAEEAVELRIEPGVDPGELSARSDSPLVEARVARAAGRIEVRIRARPGPEGAARLGALVTVESSRLGRAADVAIPVTVELRGPPGVR